MIKLRIRFRREQKARFRGNWFLNYIWHAHICVHCWNFTKGEDSAGPKRFKKQYQSCWKCRLTVDRAFLHMRLEEAEVKKLDLKRMSGKMEHEDHERYHHLHIRLERRKKARTFGVSDKRFI